MAYTIKQARRLRDFTQDEMAELLGVSRYIYLSYEKRPSTIPIGMAQKFCSIVNLSIDDIFFADEFTESEGDENA